MAAAISTAKEKAKKVAVIFKLNISTVKPKMKKPITKQMPIKPAILIGESVDFVDRQKANIGIR